MKLGSLRQGGRDGSLVVVSRDLTRAVRAAAVAPTLQRALDDWAALAPRLEEISDRLNRGRVDGEFALDPAELAAPLPRAYQWLDGSAYLSHVERVRKARGAEMPESLLTDPLMYQGVSDPFLGPRDPILAADEAWGIDLEAEIAVVVLDVPSGATPQEAARAIALVVLVNDVSLRNLIPAELAKGFGFLQGKPPTALAPVAVTPDELGTAWDGGRLRRRLDVSVNGSPIGRPDAGADMQFDFGELLAHAAKTRPLRAGTVLGAGTVSNRDRSAGVACLAEQRVLEILDGGQATTPFLRFGDRVTIDVRDDDGRSIFGLIDQQVVRSERA